MLPIFLHIPAFAQPPDEAYARSQLMNYVRDREKHVAAVIITLWRARFSTYIGHRAPVVVGMTSMVSTSAASQAGNCWRWAQRMIHEKRQTWRLHVVIQRLHAKRRVHTRQVGLNREACQRLQAACCFGDSFERSGL